MSDRTTGIIGKLKELEDDQYREKLWRWRGRRSVALDILAS
jgi:hypothetical protein